MAITTTATNNYLVKYRKQFYREWRRDNLFSPYMGNSPTSMIQTLFELRDGGDQVNVPFVGRLRGPGVSSGPLTGNEEKLDTYGMRFWIDWARNGILLTKKELRKSSIDQMETVRPLLTEWSTLLVRDEIIQALMALPSESPPANLGNDTVGGQRVNGILFGAATTAQKNAWATANSDRILYGSAVSNYVAGNFAASLANIDTTNDKASAAVLNLLKRRARAADPSIKPIRVEGGREYYVVFAGPNAFRDLATDATIVQANTQARPREGNGMDENPLFQGGDLMYNGMVIREIPEFAAVGNTNLIQTGVGTASANVEPLFLCGQNALALPQGQMPRPTERQEDDYGFLKGRGVELCYGIGKTFKKDIDGTSLKQWGVAQAFVASVNDA